MKRTIWISAFLVVGVTLGVAINHVTAQQKEPPPPARVAVVDIGHLFMNYMKAREYANTQQAESQRLQAEDAAKRQAIEKADNMLKELKPGTADYEKQEDQVERMAVEYRNWQAMILARQQRLTMQRTKDVYEDIVKATAEVARKSGCSLVMTKDPADVPTRSLEDFLDQLSRRRVLYAADNLDITPDVLRQLNEMHAAKK